MSYETYHKIKQLDNGDFIVTTKCSNDDRKPSEWIMDYYKKTYPMLNIEQRDAVFVIQGLYYGNVYYPKKYKMLEKLAIEYSNKMYLEKGYRPYDKTIGIFGKDSFEKQSKEGNSVYNNYEEYYNEWLSGVLDVVNGFIKYKNERPKENIITTKIKLNTGYYIKNLTVNSRKIGITEEEKDAQVFKRTQNELDKLIKRIPLKYEPILITLTA